MKKVELVEAIASKAGITKADATRALDATLEVVTSELVAGNKVPFIGFGTFDVVKRDARQARNPRTGETVKIPAKRAVTFKVGNALKAKVNE